MRTAKTLIRLGGCTLILLVLSCRGSFVDYLKDSLVDICWKRADILGIRLGCFFLYAVLIISIPFPYGVWGRMWNSIVSVPDHYLLSTITQGQPNQGNSLHFKVFENISYMYKDFLYNIVLNKTHKVYETCQRITIFQQKTL